MKTSIDILWCPAFRSRRLEGNNSSGRHPRWCSLSLVTNIPGPWGDLQKHPASLPVCPRWEQTPPHVSCVLLDLDLLLSPSLLSCSFCLLVLIILSPHLPSWIPFIPLLLFLLSPLSSSPFVSFPDFHTHCCIISFSPHVLCSCCPVPPFLPSIIMSFSLLFYSSLPWESVAKLRSELLLLVAPGPWCSTPIHQWRDFGRCWPEGLRLAGWLAIYCPLWTENHLRLQVRKQSHSHVISSSCCLCALLLRSHMEHGHAET